jgi:hypothetical protein
MERKLPHGSKYFNSLLSPQSLGLRFHIPEDVIMSIDQLPEIRTALHSTNVINERLDHSKAYTLQCKNRLQCVEETMNDLKRAADIFEQFAPGGREHLAVMLLLVDFLTDSGFPLEAMDQLQKFSALCETKEQVLLDPFYLYLAQSKLAWINGSFDLAINYAQRASDQSVSVEGDDVVHKQSLALNALALSRMTQLDLTSNHTPPSVMKTVLDMEDILDTFKVASRISYNDYRMRKTLLQHGSKSFASVVSTALSHCNQGVAEWLFIYTKNKKTIITSQNMSSSDVLSIDPALATWKQAITYLEEWNESSRHTDIHHNHPLAIDTIHNQLSIDLLLAKLYCNMSHALLFSTISNVSYSPSIHKQDLKNASEFASLAIKIYNKYIASDETISLALPIFWKDRSNQNAMPQGIHIQHFVQQELARALRLAAACYAKSGSAVTAQGLFQSSIDILESPHGRYPWPLSGIDAQTAVLGYAELCKNWEKRDTDYRLNMEKAEKIEQSLVPGWRQKPTIFSGVCF